MGWLESFSWTLSSGINAHIWRRFTLFETHCPFCLTNLLETCETLPCSVVSKIFITDHILYFCSKVGLRVHKVVCAWLTAWFDTSWSVPSAWSGWRSVFMKVVCRCAHWSSHQLILIYVVCWLLTHGSLDISIVCWTLFRINLILKDKEVWWLCVRCSSVGDICVRRSASRRIPHWTWLI